MSETSKKLMHRSRAKVNRRYHCGYGKTWGKGRHQFTH